MASPPVVLDTDILSAIMRQNPNVLLHAREYLAEHNRFTLSLITRYEILRGLKVKKANTQLAAFDVFCSRCTILPLSDEATNKASDIYADLSQRGLLIGDADILIAASVLVRGMSIATNNERHFSRISGLQVENWLK